MLVGHRRKLDPNVTKTDVPRMFSRKMLKFECVIDSIARLIES